ncbi:MAG TPA: GNAT family N-acetyltransferase [Acidimicrobiales bacterium]|nr:GNAT family N-acetyltransferase [Acidimicrobiales bacterium]
MEIGSGAGAQLTRTLGAARLFRARHSHEDHVITTDGRAVRDLAGEIIGLVGWGGGAPVATPAAGSVHRAITMRAYREEDYVSCRALWVELTQHRRDIYDDSSVGGSDPGAGLDHYLATPERVGSWVAEIDGRVIGMTGLFDRGDYGEVEPVVVTRAQRHLGVGRALLSRVREESLGRGHDYLTIRPVARNTSAIRAFHDFGFATLGGHMDLTWDLSARRHRWLSDAHLHGLDFRY